MVSIEEEGEEKQVVLTAAQQKKLAALQEKEAKKAEDKRVAAAKKEAEREEKLDKKRQEALNKFQKAANARLKKSQNALAARTAKAQGKKASNAVTRAALRATLHNRVLNAARANVRSLTSNNVKIPEKGASELRFQTYVNASKKRFYKRTKRHNPAQENIRSRVMAEGINEKYIKITPKYRTYNQVLAAAQTRKAKDEAKHGKSADREKIIALAQSIGLDEAKLRSAICVRKKK